MTTWPNTCGPNSPCADFTDPVNPDLGQCAPYRTQKDCEVTPLPVIQCSDDEYITVYDPDATPKFSVTARLFDSECNLILDESGDPITTTIQ